MQPAISLVVTNHDYTHSLPNLFESLLAQTCKNFEIVFVDDASTESPWSIIEAYRNRGLDIKSIFEQKRIYYKNALAKGIEASSGDIIGFIDGDDLILEPAHLEMHQALMNGTGADVVHFGTKITNETGEETGAKWKDPCIHGILEGYDILDKLTDTEAGQTLSMGMCDKLYRKSLFHNCLGIVNNSRIKLGSMDTYFNSLVLPFAQKYVGSPMKSYGYVWTRRGIQKTRTSVYTMYEIITVVIPWLRQQGCPEYLAEKLRILALEKLADNTRSFCEYYVTRDRSCVRHMALEEMKEFYDINDYIKILLLGGKAAAQIVQARSADACPQKASFTAHPVVPDNLEKKARSLTGPLALRFGCIFARYYAAMPERRKFLALLDCVHARYMDDLASENRTALEGSPEHAPARSALESVGQLLVEAYFDPDSGRRIPEIIASLESDPPAWYPSFRELKSDAGLLGYFFGEESH